jgi:hypothetical protein
VDETLHSSPEDISGAPPALLTRFASRNSRLLPRWIWLVSFMNYDLGFFDQECGRVTSAETPFDAKVLPMCPEWTARTGMPATGEMRRN